MKNERVTLTMVGAKVELNLYGEPFKIVFIKNEKRKNISSLEKANDFIKNEFLPRYNNRFALPINDAKTLFVCLIPNFNYHVKLVVYKEYSIHNHCYFR